MLRKGHFFRLFKNKNVKMKRITTSKKVELELIEQGRSKTWLASQLGISRPVLYKRLNDNFWMPREIIKLKSIGLI